MSYSDKQIDNEALLEEVKKIVGQKGDEDNRVPDPITLDIGGQKYTFKDQEELNANISSAFKNLTEQNATLMAQLEEQVRQQTQNQDSTDSPKVDYDKFASLIQKDPTAAFDYIDEIRYGPNKVPPAVSTLAEQLQQTQRQLDVYAFLNNHPEYQNTDKNAAALKSVMDNLSLNPDLRGLEVAYRTAKAYGITFEDSSTQSQGRFAQNSNQQQTQNSVSPPPPVSRGGQQLPADDIEKYLDGLTTKQLAELFQNN